MKQGDVVLVVRMNGEGTPVCPWFSFAKGPVHIHGNLIVGPGGFTAYKTDNQKFEQMGIIKRDSFTCLPFSTELEAVLVQQSQIIREAFGKISEALAANQKKK